MLQEMSGAPGGEARTTCRCADCLLPNAIMPWGSHRISVEKRALTDPKRYYLPCEPIASLSEVQQTPRGTRGQYGLGKHGQEWICVPCFEAMLAIYRKRMQRDNPNIQFLPSHPIYEVIYYILAEEREIIGQPRPRRFQLSSTKHHGLELWKARYLGTLRAADPSYIPKNTPGRVEFLEYFPGEDGTSVYLSRVDKEYRGRLEDGSLAEVSPNEVDDCTLTQLLDKLNPRRFAHLSIANRQIAAAKRANYNANPYDDPVDDPENNEPCHPSRVNAKVPVLRISDPRDDKPSDLDFRGATAPKTTPSTAPTPDVSSPKRRLLTLLIASKRASNPKTVTKIDSGASQTPREHCSAGLLMLRTPVEDPLPEHAGDDDAGHSLKASGSRSRIMAGLLGNGASGLGAEGGGGGASGTRHSRSASF